MYRGKSLITFEASAETVRNGARRLESAGLPLFVSSWETKWFIFQFLMWLSGFVCATMFCLNFVYYLLYIYFITAEAFVEKVKKWNSKIRERRVSGFCVLSIISYWWILMVFAFFICWIFLSCHFLNYPYIYSEKSENRIQRLESAGLPVFWIVLKGRTRLEQFLLFCQCCSLVFEFREIVLPCQTPLSLSLLVFVFVCSLFICLIICLRVKLVCASAAILEVCSPVCLSAGLLSCLSDRERERGRQTQTEWVNKMKTVGKKD